MPKKYGYELKELSALFHEQIMLNSPHTVDAKTVEINLTDNERVAMFQQIMNRLGEDGWILVSTAPVMVGRTQPRQQYYAFMKEGYTRSI